MDNIVDLERLWSATKITGTVVLSVFLVISTYALFRWSGEENSPWWSSVLALFLVILALLFVTYNLLGSI